MLGSTTVKKRLLIENHVHGGLTLPLFESLQQADVGTNVIAALLNTTFAHYVLDLHGRELSPPVRVAYAPEQAATGTRELPERGGGPDIQEMSQST